MSKKNHEYYSLINFIYLSLALCLPFTSFSTQLDVEINEALTAEIATVGEVIHAKCLPPDCLVIGLGRSPTPIIDYLEAVYPGGTVGLPLTAFRYSQEDHAQKGLEEERGNGKNKSTRRNIEIYESLTESEEQKLFAHFDNIFQQKIDSAKRVVVVDYTISGRSLLSSTEYLEKYLQKSGKNIEIEALALMTQNNVDRYKQRILQRTQMPELKIEHLVLPDNLATLIHGEAFDDLAPYGQFDLRHDTQPRPSKERERTTYLKNLCRMIYSIK